MIYFLRFVWDLREMNNLIYYLMKLSMILLFKCVIIKRLIINLISINSSKGGFMGQWSVKE
jgi:hypothetical protein